MLAHTLYALYLLLCLAERFQHSRASRTFAKRPGAQTPPSEDARAFSGARVSMMRDRSGVLVRMCAGVKLRVQNVLVFY